MRLANWIFSLVFLSITFIATPLLAQYDFIEIEAEDYVFEDAITDSFFYVLDDENASGGKYISIEGSGKSKRYIGWEFSTTSTTDTIYHIFFVARSRYGGQYDRQYINWDVPSEQITYQNGANFTYQSVSTVGFAFNYADSTIRSNWYIYMSGFGADPNEHMRLQAGNHNFFIRQRDVSGEYDKIIITNDLAWRPEASFYFEAEWSTNSIYDGSGITEPMTQEYLEGASNDSVVVASNEYIDDGLSVPGDYERGICNIPVKMMAPDTYYVWLYVDLPSVDANSFWIGYDTEFDLPPAWEYSVDGNEASTSGFEWVQLTDEVGDRKEVYIKMLGLGTSQSYKVKQREGLTKIDKIFITNNPDSIPGETTAIKDINLSLALNDFVLEKNYPNPFNPETNITFNIPSKGNITLTIYNILGQRINTLINKNLNFGKHQIKWNGLDSKGNSVPSGVYFYQVKFNSAGLTKVKTGKMILTK